ncbi:AprI/Inh family metalloprotease inhibitor [Breoghania sp. L-A4]|uniref:AprI/Inh family metalloprotease inhibitor n=1 Tax=Breoghania sp. L-A4 TaxID=2304600 RepID=UPI000E35D3BB|nr:AprI/Inh family metalloprotease inhibitor [Breoghania sp. L-A4]AXS39033.1 hypothetical protein D1F64_01855 [Breoghania sp. L-A4]
MTRNAVVAIVIGVTALVGGCQRLNYGPRVDPLPAVPAQPVADGGSLQPLVLTPDPSQNPPGGPYGQDPYATGPNAGDPALAGDPAQDGGPAGGAQVATAAPAGAAQLGRTEVLGGWTVTASGETCKLFMNLTTWSGGYRASTRGCSAGPLGQIAAWDLNGAQVVLKDSSGAVLAHLYKSAPERFNGQTAVGQSIAFYR